MLPINVKRTLVALAIALVVYAGMLLLVSATGCGQQSYHPDTNMSTSLTKAPTPNALYSFSPLADDLLAIRVT